MTRQLYKLLFRDVEVGTIREEDADIPNVWGGFEPSTATDHPEIRDGIRRYIEYSREADRLMQEDDALGSDWDKFASEHEPQFLDLIECDDWWLVDTGGERHPILIPNFCVDGVVWRWDPTPGR